MRDKNRSVVLFVVTAAFVVAIVVCIGVGAATFTMYRRAVEAEQAAAMAAAQERVALASAQESGQRAATASQAMQQASFELAFAKHVLGMQRLADTELAVVRPALTKDAAWQRFTAQLSADRTRVKEHFDPDDLVADDYSTLLNAACDVMSAYERQVAKLQTQLQEVSAR